MAKTDEAAVEAAQEGETDEQRQAREAEEQAAREQAQAEADALAAEAAAAGNAAADAQAAVAVGDQLEPGEAPQESVDGRPPLDQVATEREANIDAQLAAQEGD